MTLDITLGWLGEEIAGQDLVAVVNDVMKNFEQALGDTLHLELLNEPLSPPLAANPAFPPDAVFAPTASPLIMDYLEKNNLGKGHTFVLVTAGPLYTIIPEPYSFAGEGSLDGIITEVSGIYAPADKLTLINGRRLAALPGDTKKYFANVLTHELGHSLGLLDYHTPKFGYLPWHHHDRHCFMIQASGNVKTLPQEISGRQYFCKECSRKIQRWHDTLIK